MVWAALYPFMSDSSLALGKLCSSFPFFSVISSHLQMLPFTQHHHRINLLQNFLFPPHHLIFSPIFFASQLPRSQCSNPRFALSGEWKCVKTWFDRGALMHSFQSAAQKVLQGKGLQGMKSYMQRQPAPQSSQSRETPPCNSSPAEVLAGSLG